MTTTQILGFVATGLVIVGYIPQIVHLIMERGLIVGFCKRCEGEVCPFHRDAYFNSGISGHKPHRSRAS